MDRTPGDGPSDWIHHYEFSADEIEVAATLTQLNFLILLYEFLNYGFLPPIWGSKRLRSSCAPDRQRTESAVVATACPVISCGGNLRNISPDSPLLLKAMPTSGGGAQGSPCIVVEPPREKEVTKKHEWKDDVDDSAGIKKSKNIPLKEKTERRNVKRGRTESEELPVRTIPGQFHGRLSVSLVTRDPSSASDPLPDGGAHASPSSSLQASRPMLLFDLNLTPPDCSGIQSPLPDEDGTPGLPPSDGEVEATGAARQKRLGYMEGEIVPQGCSIGHQGTEPRVRQSHSILMIWNKSWKRVSCRSIQWKNTGGSIEEVAEKLMILHEDCLGGNFASIQKLREASAKEAGHSTIKKVVSDDDGDDCSDTDESMDMAVDAPEHRSNQTPGAMPVDEPKKMIFSFICVP